MAFRMPVRLETERLVLRMFENGDGKALHRYYGDPVCVRYTIGRVLSEVESWREVAVRAGHWILRGYGPYAVEERSGGAVVGIIGLWYPEGWPEPEVTWHLVRSRFGRGYASEGARAVIAAQKIHIPEISFISLIHPENEASAALARRLGARYERSVLFRDGSWDIYRHA